jgi:hypothetical protein
MEYWNSGIMGKRFSGIFFPYSLFHSSIIPVSLYSDCIKLAGLIAGPALHAFLFVQQMWFFLLPGNRIHGTNLETGSAARALFGVDGKRDKPLTIFGRAFFVLDMGFIFLSEIPKGGQDGVGGRESKATKRCVPHHLREVL